MDHEAIHWLEFENKLNGYDIFPNHILHPIYNPEDDIQEVWKGLYSGIRDDMYKEIKRFKSPTLIELMEDHMACDDTPTEENIRKMEAMLYKAQQVSKQAKSEDLGTALYQYFSMIGNYTTLLSMQTSEQFQGNPNGAVQFLRNLQESKEDIAEKIDLKVRKFEYSDYDKYQELVEKTI